MSPWIARWSRIFSGAAALLWVGCGGNDKLAGRDSCQRDDDCGGGEVCFVDGCGSADENVAIEVTPNSSASRAPQDFLRAEIHRSEDFVIEKASALVGSVLQRSTDAATQPTPYTGAVTLTLSGQSSFVPTITRTFSAKVTPGTGGAFRLAAGTGIYNLTATPADESIPLFVADGQQIQPGQDTPITVQLSAPDSAIAITGNLFYTRNGKVDEKLPGQMVLQAIDPISRRALSQRTSPKGGDASFTLYVDPSVGLGAPIGIRAFSLQQEKLIPEKTFITTATPGPLAAPLQMGDFGEAVQVSGTLKDRRGVAIAGATVFIEGRAVGGGTFRTQAAQTDTNGLFNLKSLVGENTAALTFWAVPPAKSTAGILQTPAVVSPSGLSAAPVCPDKVRVVGKVTFPEGSVPSARLMAEPLQAISGHPLPRDGGEIVVFAGQPFSLPLDPGVYRLTLVPVDSLPRVVRILTVPAVDVSSTDMPELNLPDPYVLEKGRTLTGSVYAYADPSAESPTLLPGAQLRFFKVFTDGASTSASLIGEAVTDSRGVYNVVLPGRE